MAKAKKGTDKKDEKLKREDSFEVSVEFVNEIPLNVSEMTIIEIMHQKNLSREDAISFIKNNQRK